MVETYDWSGWSLSENQFGKEFDLEARKRMVAGSRLLLPLIEHYYSLCGSTILEAGPFFTPLFVPSEYHPDRKIVYVDNDPFALSYLKERYSSADCLSCDLNREMDLLPQKIEDYFGSKSFFSAAVASQLLNYIDYEKFLKMLPEILLPQGLLFINNPRDYGLPEYFSPNRPKSDYELIAKVMESGFQILEKEEVPSPNIKFQPYSRLLLVLRKT